MCGIVFAVAPAPVGGFVREAHALQRHRGPDDEGLLFERVGALHLGYAHQRLAILDLSAAGRQPMVSTSGRTVMIFNGEIYNYRALAEQYGLTQLRSGTDTEVALELIEKIGMEAACQAFNGMWAMVVHDRPAGRILVSRDRFGKKPLNIHRRGSAIYMASEAKSLAAVPGFDPAPDLAVAARFLSQLVQNMDNRTWLDGVEAFPPASLGEIDLADTAAGVVNVRRYWTPEIDQGAGHGDTDWIGALRATLQDATALRLHADVPVGVALSGGLDSSVLAALSQTLHGAAGQEVVLFSIGHPGAKDDESPFVDMVARHLGVEVRRFSLELGDGFSAWDLIRTCNQMNDGPLSSLSSVLFYKMMEQARAEGVTVVLTGQGADEAFCGYRKYPALETRRLVKSGRLVSAARFLGGYLARGTMLPQFNFSEAKRYLGRNNAGMLGAAIKDAQPVALGAFEGEIAARQLLDVERFSVPYLCHYEDRMSMAHAREVRSPFLDYRVMALGLAMPTALKMRSGWTKYALRRAFADLLPPEITWRKDKRSFVNPEGEWFRGALKTRVLEMMGDPANPVYALGLLDRARYLETFERYCAGSSTVWFRDIFAPVSLALWLDALPRRTAAAA